MQGEFIVHENTTPLPTIHVVSDSVGLTAQAMARAAAAQFGVTNPNIEVLPHVRSFEEVKQFIAEHGQLHKRLARRREPAHLLHARRRRPAPQRCRIIARACPTWWRSTL